LKEVTKGGSVFLLLLRDDKKINLGLVREN